MHFYINEYFVCMYAYGTDGGIRQKMTSDLIVNGCEQPRSCCVLNLGTPEEQPVLLTDKSSLLPLD